MTGTLERAWRATRMPLCKMLRVVAMLGSTYGWALWAGAGLLVPGLATAP